MGLVRVEGLVGWRWTAVDVSVDGVSFVSSTTNTAVTTGWARLGTMSSTMEGGTVIRMIRARRPRCGPSGTDMTLS